ncbi:unnamed protein product [Nyctereutes procyonoides]|uniref:(raccoon dog) hypothetical protein n=1 Tax=Nyctereutes procyonoides TaxID=34880 RepID=A0A811YPX8_NYCPR|nr:unnamed protein product [Nyctereutes procyonoides]
MADIQTAHAYQKLLTIVQNKKMVLLRETGEERLLQRTIFLCGNYLHCILMYNYFKKHHKNIFTHLPPCFRDIHIGDMVTVGKCQPSNKTVCSGVLKIPKAMAARSQKS